MARPPPAIPDELLDQLLAGRDPGSARSAGGVLDELERAFAERALNAEMDHHLAEEAAEGGGNRRNGNGRKTLLTETGKLPIAVPRDRLVTFDPQLIAHEMGPSTGVACPASTTVRRIRKRSGESFPRRTIAMYGRGLTVREIQGHLAELYGLDVSPELVSAVTDAILPLKPWGHRRLAEPALGGGLPAGLLRRPAGQEP